MGGNLRTTWVTAQLNDAEGNSQVNKHAVKDVVIDMLNPLSLALGTLVTCPQQITFDAAGNRNDVEHYSESSAPFSHFIPVRGWDTPIKETVEAWFSATRPKLLALEEVAVTIRQHLDACSHELYLETRAMVAATLLDVLAGRYAAIWAPQTSPDNVSFRNKLERLLADLNIRIDAKQMNLVIKARNSLVHSGRFVTSESNSEYRNMMLLGRSILLHLAGFPSTLHEAMEG